MEKSRIEQSSRNIVFAMINKIIMLLVPFVVRTILIYTLGVNYVGLNGLFSSILSVLSLAELGFGSALIVNMYKPMAEDDKITIRKLLGYYKKVYKIIGVIILVSGLMLTPFIGYLVKEDIPRDMNLYILFLLYLFNTCASYLLFGYRNSLFIADQRNDIVSKIAAITNIVTYSMQIIVLLIFKQYYMYVIVFPITTILNNLIIYFLSKKIYPDIFCEDNLDNAIKKDISSKTKALIGHKIGGIVANSLDSVVISAFLGLVVLGKYNNYYYIMWNILGIVNSITSVIVPSVANSIIKRNLEDNKRYFDIFNFVVQGINVLFCTCFICLYQPFIKLWVGAENTLSISIAILMTIYFFVNCSRQIVLMYKDALGLWKPDWLRPYIEAIVNLFLNILLISIIGLEGVIISTIISMGFVTIPWETKMLYDQYFKTSSKEYINRLLYNFIVSFICSSMAYFVCSKLSYTGISAIIINLIVAVIISAIGFLCFYFFTARFKNTVLFAKKVIVQLKKK